VQRYVATKLQARRLKPKTINNTLVPLKEMFMHAVRWGYLRENPAHYVEKPRVLHREMDFCTTSGMPLDRGNVVKREFLPVLKKASLRRIRFHDLRHTCATLLIDQGESPKYI